ncbi:DUF6285 domain-containing protein [Myxococcota bacterium]|nr:DUF6285 domain-containing protein [Myxococcota bacterium]
MHERPDALELITAVREFLSEHAMNELEGRTRFHARVAVNALGIVERELTLRGPACEREAARLRDLLGTEGELDEQVAELSKRIRSGELADDDEALLEHLWSTALDKLAIDQPGYAAYQRALEQREKR